MDKAELLARIAPCSLLCHTCSAYADGVMAELSRELLHYTQGVAEFEGRYNEHRARQVQAVRDDLAHCANAPCGGCRDKRNCCCSIANCDLRDCTRAHGVDFCGHCAEFPCEKPRTFFEPIVYEQWLRGGEEIRERGIAAYWEAHRAMPHYLPYRRERD